VPKSWVAFFYAIPADAIVLLSLRSAWRDFRWNQVLISLIVWGALLSIYVTLLVFFQVNIWKLFLLGVPGQVAVLLWFRLYRKVPKEEENG
jgi:Flp pilus assembly protein TadB